MYIVVDLDDTLLNSERQITEYTHKVFNELREKGHKIVINTARSFFTASRLINELKPDYSILNGGSLVIDKDKNIIHSDSFDNNVNEVIRALGKISDRIAAQTFEVLYTTDPTYKLQNAQYKDLLKEDITEDVYKVIFMANSDEEVRKIALEFDLEYVNYLNGPWYRVTPKGITKFSGIENLMKITGDKVEDVIAFGDDYSDLEMLLNVGHGVAMANSVSYVLEKVKNHALSHNEDGVAKYLVEYMSKKSI